MCSTFSLLSHKSYGHTWTTNTPFPDNKPGRFKNNELIDWCFVIWVLNE